MEWIDLSWEYIEKTCYDFMYDSFKILQSKFTLWQLQYLNSDRTSRKIPVITKTDIYNLSKIKDVG